MRSFKNIFLTLLFLSVLQAFGQSVAKSKGWGVLLSYGNTSFFPETNTKSQNIFYATNPNPLLSGQFRYMALTVEKSFSKNFIGSVSIGYTNMMANITLRDTSQPWSSSYDIELNKAVFIEPSIAFQFHIDSTFSILPGVGLSIHSTYNTAKITSLESYNTRLNGIIITESKTYTTLNPQIELRFMPLPKVCLSIKSTYFIGYSEVFNIIGQVQSQTAVFPYSASYSGSAVLLAVKVGYRF